MAKVKDKKKDDIKLAVRYAVSVPEKDLMTLIKDNGAMALRMFCSTVKSIKKSGRIPQGFFDDIGKFTDILESMANIAWDVQMEWGEALKKYADEGKSPSEDLNKWNPPKVTTKKPSLSVEEKAKVERLRRKGFTIKDIGKELHRAEKVVSDYVHLLEKKAKKRR